MDYAQLLEGFYFGKDAECVAEEEIAVAYEHMPNSVLVDMHRIGLHRDVVFIVLNLKLLSDEFYGVVKEGIGRCESGVVKAAERAGLDVQSLLLLYVAENIEKGHCDPDQAIEIKLSDVSYGWRAQMMWMYVLHDIEARIWERRRREREHYARKERYHVECGDPQQANS